MQAITSTRVVTAKRHLRRADACIRKARRRPAGSIVAVKPSQASMLPAIVAGAAAGSTVQLDDGTYSVTASIWISKPGVTLRSTSGKRDAVILDGAYAVDEIVDIGADELGTP
jgi:hypothetical protein